MNAKKIKKLRRMAKSRGIDPKLAKKAYKRLSKQEQIILMKGVGNET